MFIHLVFTYSVGKYRDIDHNNSENKKRLLS